MTQISNLQIDKNADTTVQVIPPDSSITTGSSESMLAIRTGAIDGDVSGVDLNQMEPWLEAVLENANKNKADSDGVFITKALGQRTINGTVRQTSTFTVEFIGDSVNSVSLAPEKILTTR